MKQIDNLRLRIMAAMPLGATATDVDVEVALLIEENEDRLDEFLARFDEKGGADDT